MAAENYAWRAQQGKKDERRDVEMARRMKDGKRRDEKAIVVWRL